MKLKDLNKICSPVISSVLTVFMIIQLFVIYSSDSNSFKSNEEQLSISAIVQTSTSPFQFEKRIDTKNQLPQCPIEQQNSFIKIKIKSYLIQLDNELSIDQKYYSFLTSHFATGT